MSKIQITGLTSLIASYSFMVLNFILDDSYQETVYLFYIAWFFGVISVMSNLILAERVEMKGLIIGVFGICGLLWFLPFLLVTYFGIPCMLIFLVIGIYIHVKIFANNKVESKKTN